MKNHASLALSRYYFATYMMGAVFVTYGSIYFKNRGLSASQIAMVNTAPLLAILLFSLFVGRLADRASDWKMTIIIGNSLAAIFICAIGFAHGFWPILLVMTLMTAPQVLVGAVADAASVRVAQRLGFNFGSVRAYGTIGFVLVSIFAGYAIEYFHDNAFVILLIVFGFFRMAMSFQLPKMRDPNHVPQAQTGFLISKQLRGSLSVWLILPLISVSILLAAHAAHNNYSNIVWQENGIGEGMIGVLVAFGAAAEALIMFFWGWFQKHFTSRHLIIMAGLGAVLRWLIMIYSHGLFGYFLAQFMQSLSFTCAYLGGAYFIASRVAEDIAAESQSLFQIIQLSAMIVMINLFGIVFQSVNVDAYWILVALSIVSMLLVYWSLQIFPSPKKRP